MPVDDFGYSEDVLKRVSQSKVEDDEEGEEGEGDEGAGEQSGEGTRDDHSYSTIQSSPQGFLQNPLAKLNSFFFLSALTTGKKGTDNAADQTNVTGTKKRGKVISPLCSSRRAVLILVLSVSPSN